MRGGSQSILLEADDGYLYVVKLQDNPQHRRTLVNEWIATGLLRSMGISAPIPAMIEVSQSFLDQYPLVCFHLGSKVWRPSPGVHFGSRYPDNITVYDFLPRILLKRLRNLSDFVGALVMDVWLAHADNRQAVFYRCDNSDGEVPAPFTAVMIDNGYCLGGAEWNLERKIAPLHLDKAVYEGCWCEEVIEGWLARLERIPESLMWELAATIPAVWLGGDRIVLDGVIDGLLHRRGHVLDLIQQHVVQRGLLGSPRVRRVPVGRASRKSGRQLGVA